ncbi:hypothetical protein ABK040_001420 [Willaertia magna]
MQKDSEEWLIIFQDIQQSIQQLTETIQERYQQSNNNNQNNNNNFTKQNAEIRRQFKSIERVLIDLKETCPNLNDISKNEILRRMNELQQVIQKEQFLKNKFENLLKSNNSQNNTLQNNNTQSKNKLFNEYNDDYNDYNNNYNNDYNKNTKNIKNKMNEIDDDRFLHLENGQLLQLQNQMIENQDKSLDALSLALERTKFIGQSIDEELNEHSKLLGDLNENVEITDNKINIQVRKIVGLTKKSSFMCWGMIVAVVLFIVAIGLLIVLFSTWKW